MAMLAAIHGRPLFVVIAGCAYVAYRLLYFLRIERIEERRVPHVSRVSRHGNHEPMRFRCSFVTDFWHAVVVPSWHAIWAGTFLRARSSALYHRELLSAGTAAGLGSAPRSVRESSRAGAPEIPVCGGKLRGHARTFPSLNQLTRACQPFSRHPGFETWGGAADSGLAEAARAAEQKAAVLVARWFEPSNLAGAVL